MVNKGLPWRTPARRGGRALKAGTRGAISPEKDCFMVKDDRSLIEGPWTRKAAPRRPSGEPPVFNAPGVVVWTISFLVACFIALAFAPGRFATQLEWAAGVVPLRFLAGPQGNGGVLAMIAPLFAHMALHANLMHIFFNSIWLLIFGAAVERLLASGTARSAV